MRTNKGLYGIMAFAPLFFSIVMIIVMVVWISEMDHYRYRSYDFDSYYSGPDPDEVFNGSFFVFIGAAIITGLVSLVSLIMYIIHAAKSPAMMENNRTAWILIMIFGGSIGRIVYFFMMIVNEEERLASVQATKNNQGY